MFTSILVCLVFHGTFSKFGLNVESRGGSRILETGAGCEEMSRGPGHPPGNPWNS